MDVSVLLCVFVREWEQPASCLHAVGFIDYAPTTAPSFQHDVPTIQGRRPREQLQLQVFH